MVDNTIKCRVKNVGDYACDEVLQLYVTQPKADYSNPIKSLINVSRFNLKPGEEKEIELVVNESYLYSVNDNGDTMLLMGDYSLFVTDGSSIESPIVIYSNNQVTQLIESSPI